MPLIEPGSAGRHRYGIVLVLAIATVVFLIVAPDRTGSRVVGMALAGCMLLVVIATGRTADRALRRSGAAALILLTAGLALAVLTGGLPKWVASGVAGVLVILTLGQLVRGVARLLRTRGVTVQAVAGALAVYLLLGVFFSLAIGVAARLGHGSYFAQGTDGNESQHVYFSFTTLTTTGYGDLSPATSGGRALAVLEMLTGQIYLVTVISLLVGNLRRRGEPGPAA
jgi:Ion channel